MLSSKAHFLVRKEAGVRASGVLTLRGLSGTPSLPLQSLVGVRFNSTKSPQGVVPKPKKEKKPLWTTIKEGASHYWDGTKLLGFEMKISSRLLMKMSAGKTLTRREMIQLKRTTQDVVRLVPFAAFVLIPFAELLLPLALKIFPNLLPSTYESSQSKESKLKSLRKTRELVTDIIKDNKAHFKPQGISDEQKVLFNRFYKHVRATGESESREQLVQVARLFTDDTVLDNLSRPYLVALAKYINIQPFGTDVILRYRIRYKLLELKKDDFALYYEDTEQLSSAELRSACASRGIRIKDTDDAALRTNLKLWLDMRIKDKIPSTLLVLATSYNYGDASSTKSLYDSLCDVLSAIPDELYHEVKVNVVKEADATAKQKLEHLKEQDEIMKEESQQEAGSMVTVKDSLSLDDIDKVQEEASEEVKTLLEKTEEAKEAKEAKEKAKP